MKTTLSLIAAIILGAIFGAYFSSSAEGVSQVIDPLILGLVTLLFFEVPYEAIGRVKEHLRFVALAWTANFLLIPVIGLGIAWLWLRHEPMLFIGLFIYFMAPCTDWFLGFTRMAHGNTLLGVALIPINLVSQLLLYPVYLGWLAGTTSLGIAENLPATLSQWFFIPLMAALSARFFLRWVLSEKWFQSVIALVGKAIPLVIAALIFCIFATHITTIVEHANAFLLILAAVFFFFVLTYFLGQHLSQRFHLSYPEHALLTMTTAARNTPLMLGVTVSAFPGQPLIYAALVIRMLVEFPHLTVLRHLLLKQVPSSSTVAAATIGWPKI